MLTRFISSIIALPLLFFFVLMGGLYLEVAVGIVSLIALYEFFAALKKKSLKPSEFITYVLLIALYIILHFELSGLISIAILIYVAYLLVQYLFNPDKKFADVGVTIVAAFYVIFFFYHVVLLSNLEPSFYIWYIFIVSWGADTGAYFAGVSFGKHKMMPSVSPKKTIEGAVGGVLSAILISVIFTLFNDKSFVIYSVFIGITGSLISIVGDLIASRIKREMDVKDFGNIMPGHGGVLDRFDSLLFVTPFVYYFIKFILTI